MHYVVVSPRTNCRNTRKDKKKIIQIHLKKKLQETKMCPYYCFTMALQAIHFMILVLILRLLLLLMKNEDTSGMDRMKTRRKNIQDCNNGYIDVFLGNAPELYNNRGIDALLGKAPKFENNTVAARDSVPNDNNETGYRRNCVRCQRRHRRRRRTSTEIPPISPHAIQEIV